MCYTNIARVQNQQPDLIKYFEGRRVPLEGKVSSSKVHPLICYESMLYSNSVKMAPDKDASSATPISTTTNANGKHKHFYLLAHKSNHRQLY